MSFGISSGAYKEQGYDLMLTIEASIRSNLSAVQLYVDASKHTEDYILQVIQRLKEYTGTIVIHMRDVKDTTKNDDHLIELLDNELKDRNIKILTHYYEGMGVDEIPLINGKRVGIENSKTGEFDMDHVRRVLQLSTDAEVSFVFDYGRVLYGADNVDNTEKINAITKFIIEELDPKTDIIHSADKRNWQDRFRGQWLSVGNKDGIGYGLISALKTFVLRGGVIIFEHESLEAALDSTNVFVEA